MVQVHLGFVLGLISLVVPIALTQIQFPGLGAGNAFPYGRNPFQQLNSPYALPGLQYPQQVPRSSLFRPQDNQILEVPQYSSYAGLTNGILGSPQLTQRSISTDTIPSQLLPGTSEPVRGGFSIGNGSYVLEWEVNEPYITFRAKRRGAGFVGFAISPSGGMSGADIFIAGIGPTGMAFASDYHHEYQPGGVGSAVPDVSMDYQVLDLSESNGYTSVKFQRLLDTGDIKEDHAIENREQNVLWSIGPPSRGLEYHGPTNRGVVKINLVNPPAKFRLSKPLS